LDRHEKAILGAQTLKKARNMKILILDDSADRHEYFNKRLAGFEIFNAWTAIEAIELLAKHSFDYATLDHDLGPGPTGLEVAKYICATDVDKRPKQISVHSNNVVASQRMLNVFKDFSILCDYQPFTIGYNAKLPKPA
jgi:CheY-like chemotaxis protein